MKRQTCYREPRDREQTPNNQNKSRELRRHSPIPNRTINYGKHYILPPYKRATYYPIQAKCHIGRKPHDVFHYEKAFLDSFDERRGA